MHIQALRPLANQKSKYETVMDKNSDAAAGGFVTIQRRLQACISRFHGLWYALPLVYLAELLAAKPGHAVNRSLLRISQTRRRRTFPASSVDPRRANPYSI